MNPIDEAMQTIDQLHGTGSAEGLAKLILTLYNAVHPFSIRECFRSFDDTRTKLGLRMIDHFLTNGEDDSLLNAGQKIYDTWPSLVVLSNAGSNAKAEVLEKWRDEMLDDLPVEE